MAAAAVTPHQLQVSSEEFTVCLISDAQLSALDNELRNSAAALYEQLETLRKERQWSSRVQDVLNALEQLGAWVKSQGEAAPCKPFQDLANCERIYRTQAHLQMYKSLLMRADALSRGNYHGKSGNVSSCMVGVRGVGKTRTLRTLTLFLRLLDPRLLPVYVDFNNVSTDTTILGRSSLDEILTEVLREAGGPLANAGRDVPWQLWLKRLPQQDSRYLLLFVDELDAAYMASQPSQQAVLSRSLGTLKMIGSLDTGRVMAVLSGSSLSIPSLIKCNFSEILLDHFPLLGVSKINLNGNKFATWRIYSSNPAHLDDVRAVFIGNPHILLKVTEEDVRLTTFIVGNTARTVERLLTAPSLETYQELCADRDGSSETMAQQVYSCFFTAIMQQLCLKNAKVIISLQSDEAGGLDADLISSVQWEKQVQPLDRAECQAIWDAMIEKQIVDPARYHLRTSLEHLADRAWIALEEPSFEGYDEVWPHDMLQMIRLFQTGWLERTLDTLKRLDNGVDSVKLAGRKLADGGLPNFLERISSFLKKD